MKIDLPLETWTDVFAFLPRRQLVQIVPHFEPYEHPWQKSLPPTIGDRQFVSFVQFYLHKCSEITLDHLWIKQYGDWRPTLSKLFGSYALPLTDVSLPMPGNIKNFQEIALEHFNDQNSIVDFLQEFQHNSLLTDVNVVFQQCNSIDPDAVLAFLTTILPLITSINSITLENTDLFPVLLDKYWDLAKPMLASARVLYINRALAMIGTIGFALHGPREDGKSRLLKHYDFCGAHLAFSFIEHIKKDFMDAKKAEQAVSFFVKLYVYLDDDQHVEELTLDNWQTQERLVIKEHRDMNYDDVSISRFPIGANAEWIEDMAKDPIFECRHLRIFC